MAKASLTDEQMKKIAETSDLATCCLTMVSVYVTLNDVKFTVYAMPWDWLETCRTLYLAGATDISAWPGRSGAASEYWYWTKPTRAKRRAA